MAAALGGALGWFLGGMSDLIYALIIFTILDYLTGFARAAMARELSSRVGARGIVKKVGIFLIVGVAHLADVYLLGDSGALRSAVIFFYLSNEGLSIIENADALGVPIPGKLTEFLAKVHDQSDTNVSNKPDTPDDQEDKK